MKGIRKWILSLFSYGEVMTVFKIETVREIFLSQQKPIGKELTELMFIDSNGKRYYKFIDPMDIPIERWGHINRLYQELSNCISSSELEMFITAMDKALNLSGEGNVKSLDVGQVIMLVKEMKVRKEMLLHPDLMMEIVSAHYFREDENPALWDEELHNEKIQQFTKDKGDGLYDFFQKAGLTELMPFLKLSEEDWKIYMDRSAKKIQAMKTYISGKQSIKEEKTESVS